MEERKFQVGDTVRLKSGGQVMTVDVAETMLGRVSCVWFDGKKPMEAEFSEGALEKCEPPRPGVASAGSRMF